MKKMLILLGLSLASTALLAKGLPYYPVSFPRDEGAHYANVPYDYKYLVEWWYFNGSLTTDDNRHFGFDTAFFNTDVQKDGDSSIQPMLHMQISDLDNKKSYGVETVYDKNEGSNSTDHLNISLNDDYSLSKKTIDGQEVYVLKAQTKNKRTALKFDLILKPVSPVLLINQIGYMPMAHKTDTYYYSIPHFITTGTIEINGKSYTVHNTPGDAWLDHQWGNFNVFAGWQWFSVRLDNGLVANIFLNISHDNARVIGGLANIVLPDGSLRFIDYNHFTATPTNYWYDQKLKISFPTEFTINIPELSLNIDNIAAYPDQEVLGYWEGYAHISATYQQQNVNGFSYTELVYH